MSLFFRYMNWLHTRWPAGTVEKLPEVNADGTTAVPGLRVVGDLTGIPLLKFAVDTGAKAIQAILAEPGFARGSRDDDTVDVAVIGGGLAGIAAAIEAKKAGLTFKVFEAAKTFATIKDFPKGKPIFTYPTGMTPAGELELTADVKEDLVSELEAQRDAHGIEPVIARIESVERRGKTFVLHAKDATYQAQRVIVAIGRSGNFRKLAAPGEDKVKVFNRLHDPKEFAGKSVLVVGGGDSAIEASIALSLAGAKVTHSYRRDSFSRPKPENVEKLNQLLADPAANVAVEDPSSERATTSFTPAMCARIGAGSICLAMSTQLVEIRDDAVDIKGADGTVETLPNDVVFSMIGREPPLDFFRRSGVPIRGEWRAATRASFVAFLLFCFWMYHWKTGKPIPFLGSLSGWLNPRPGALWSWIATWGDAAAARINDPATLPGTIKISMSDPAFTYALAYSLAVVIFGIRRIRRRRTPYARLQTLTLMAVQCIPLFVLPEIILPWLGHNGWFSEGWLKTLADSLFPLADYGHGREYWRAYGLILAWPLMAWNFFTDQPLWGWLIIGALQTFFIIPVLIYFWGKGAYCGWICSCGALAETMGDRHRHKMPHGPKWNRLNMIGQVLLAWSFVLMIIRVLGWIWPSSPLGRIFEFLAVKVPVVNYKWLLDIMLAGVIGYGCYFWFSGRVWCRFACPLAALMHIYARFSRFRIFAEKKKCISCNVCTSVCHQGIDVMNFANKGAAMEDPECVRCSACVESCPTGVLSFGRFGSDGRVVPDRLVASLVRVDEVGLPE